MASSGMNNSAELRAYLISEDFVKAEIMPPKFELIRINSRQWRMDGDQSLMTCQSGVGFLKIFNLKLVPNAGRQT